MLALPITVPAIHCEFGNRRQWYAFFLLLTLSRVLMRELTLREQLLLSLLLLIGLAFGGGMYKSSSLVRKHCLTTTG